ncbi:MAG: tetratricopeptide repeat protein [Pseudomonadota bacterium]
MHRGIVFGLVLALAVSGIPAQAQKKEAVRLNQEAESLSKKGDVAKAIATYRRAIAKDPDYVDAYGGLAVVYLHTGKFAEAVKLLLKAVSRVPDYAQGWYNLAYAQRKLGDLAASIDAYRRYSKLEPSHPDPYFGLGLALQAKGDYAEAAASFKRYAEMEKDPKKLSWVKKAKKLAEDLNQKAQAGGGGKAKGKEEKTTAAEVISPAPTDAASVQRFSLDSPLPDTRDDSKVKANTPERRQAMSHKERGDVLAKQERYEEAIGHYYKAVAVDYSYSEAYDQLAKALFALGQYQEAIRTFRIAVRDDPSYATGWHHYGYALRKADRLPEALAAYRKSATLRPQDPGSFYGLGLTYRGMAKNERAVEAFNRYLLLEKRKVSWTKKAQSFVDELGAKSAVVASAEDSGQPAGGVEGGKKLPADVFAKAAKAAGIVKETKGKEGETGEMIAPVAESPKMTAKQKRAEARRARVEKWKAKKEAARQARVEASEKRAEARRARMEAFKAKRDARRMAKMEAKKARFAAARLKKGGFGTIDQIEDEKIARSEAVRTARISPKKIREAEDLATNISEDAQGEGIGSTTRFRGSDILAPASDAARGLVEVADKQFAEQRFVIALGIYMQAAQADPTSAEVLYKAGVTAVALGRMHLAADLFERVLQLSPGNESAAVNLKLARAAASAKKPSDEYQQDAILSAKRHLEAGRYALAEQQLTRFVEHVESAQAFELRAEARLALRKPRLALADGSRALALDPGFVDGFRVMGDSHRQLNHGEKARYYYRLYLVRSEGDSSKAEIRESVLKTMAAIE